MIDVLQPSRTAELPPLPPGWHVVTYAVLADGTLAIVGCVFDLRGIKAASRVRPTSDGDPASRPPDPFNQQEELPARIWTFDGTSLSEGPSFGLRSFYPMLERFPDGRWLVTSRPSAGEPSSRILDADGHEVRRIQFGDGVNHIQIDDAGHIWVGWSDEGVFGNHGFIGDRMTWENQDLPYPPSEHGLVAFDEHGGLMAQAPFEAGIADCYTLNVTGHTAWACTYENFPIMALAVGQSSRLWTTKLSGPSALAVRPPHVLVAGGHFIEDSQFKVSDRVGLFRLDDNRIEPLREWRLPFQPFDQQRPDLYEGRGEVLHIIRDGCWYRWHIGDALGA